MKAAGIIGLGDMGSGLAKSLISSGFQTTGFDLAPDRMSDFAAQGGVPATSVAEVAENAAVVFVMVMNGDQARSVILGDDGLANRMIAESTIILTATIMPSAGARDWGRSEWIGHSLDR